MATLKEIRQGNKRWVGSTYGTTEKPSKEEICNATDITQQYDPEDYESTTVPGQSKSIKELMDRYEKGRPLPTK